MRLTPLMAVLAIAAGYFISVPLFGHKYGVLEDGRPTKILSEKDAAICAEASYAHKALGPPVPAEVEEVPSEPALPRDPSCDLKPVTSVSWDWLYLPKAVLRRSPNMQDTAGVLTVVSEVLFWKSTWEVVASSMLVLSVTLLVQLLRKD